MPEGIETFSIDPLFGLGFGPFHDVDIGHKRHAGERAQKRLKQILSHLAERRKHFPQATGLDNYEPRSTDIIVTTFPKAGTTLTQQLAYQTVVATGGAPNEDPDGDNFSDICQVAPWLDYIPQIDYAFMEGNPRVFKTHAGVDKFDIDRQRHVVVLRDPLKFPASWLNFTMDNYPDEVVTGADARVRQLWFDHTIACDLLGLGESTLGDSGALGPNEGEQAGGIRVKFGQNGAPDETSTDDVEAGRLGPWFVHTLGWVEVAGHPNVLILFYEDVVKDMASAVRHVASFMGRQLTREGLAQVVHRCGRDYMATGDRFKSYMDSKLFGTDMNSSKVRHEHHNAFRNMTVSDDHLKELRRQMVRAFGVPTYKEMKDLVKAKQSQYRFTHSYC